MCVYVCVLHVLTILLCRCYDRRTLEDCSMQICELEAKIDHLEIFRDVS